MTADFIDLDAEAAASLQSLIDAAAEAGPKPPTGAERKAALADAIAQSNIDKLMALQEKMSGIMGRILANKNITETLGTLSEGDLYALMESIDAAAEHVKKNWESTSKNRAIKAWMPEKVDMPAIEPEQLAQVAKDIASGDMDINPPYSDKVKSLLKMSTKKEKSPPENAGRRISGDPLVERWQRLAGIIKLDLEKS
jgi:hypothetical protein